MALERPGKEPLTAGKVRCFSVPINMSKVMNKMNEATSTVVAKINNVEIVVVENGQKLVPVKPICQALGIAFEPQYTRLKNDPILSSVVMLSVTTGADGKQYEMVTIPFRYIFGWLFQIDSRNVKEEARDGVLRYQRECYDVLYNHHTRIAEYHEYKEKMIEEQLMVYDVVKHKFHTAKNQMVEVNKELNRRRQFTFEQFNEQNSQLSLFTNQEGV